MSDVLYCLEEVTTARIEVLYRNQMISIVANIDTKVKDFIRVITGTENPYNYDLIFAIEEWYLHHEKNLRTEGVMNGTTLVLLDNPTKGYHN